MSVSTHACISNHACHIKDMTCILGPPQLTHGGVQGRGVKSDPSIPSGGFHKWGYPNSWMVRENPTNMDDLGIPL